MNEDGALNTFFSVENLTEAANGTRNPSGDLINSRRANGSDYWYRQDSRGSTTNIVDASDTVAKSYTYDAYGNTSSTGTFINSFAYTGAVIDPETGLYYMNARYYEPGTGRFISEDTYRGDEEAFRNLYMYCNGDPINNIDPNGKDLIGLMSSLSLKHDDVGCLILTWWLYGNGQPHSFVNGYFGDYMKKDKILKRKVKDRLFPIGDRIKSNYTKHYSVETKMEIENGEDIIGYEYLHGTNKNAGGFRISGTIRKDALGIVTYNLRYTWNDMIDPNFKYSTDRIKALIATLIPGAHPKNYYIHISWTDVSRINPAHFGSGWLGV